MWLQDSDVLGCAVSCGACDWAVRQPELALRAESRPAASRQPSPNGPAVTFPPPAATRSLIPMRPRPLPVPCSSDAVPAAWPLVTIGQGAGAGEDLERDVGRDGVVSPRPGRSTPL